MLEQRLAKTGTQGRRGAGVLDGLIAARLVGSPRPRQRGERMFLRIVQQYGLPMPEREVEYLLSDGRTVYVDFVFCRVVGAEIDSYLHHSSLTDWAADRTRNNLVRTQGLTLLNVTEPDMKRDPAGVAAQHEEARGVVRTVFDFRGQYLEPIHLGGCLAGNRGRALLVTGATRAFRVTRNRNPLDVGQMLIQPHPALARCTGQARPVIQRGVAVSGRASCSWNPRAAPPRGSRDLFPRAPRLADV